MRIVFTDEIIDLLLVECSEGFDWSDISPTIFGAVFESILNHATRRSGGMHYISIENIHKVITDAQKAKIEKTAQAILDARALYPDSSLADLYDELTMPKELRRAHQENDKAVMTAYGFDWRNMTESQCVAELMKMYQQLTARER